MKITIIKRGIFAIVAVLATSLSQADDTTGQQQQSQTSGQTTSPSEVRFSKLKDAKVTSLSGENLGQIEDLLISPNTGKIDFVVLGRGGFLGMGEKRVPVPWQAVNVQSERQFSVNIDKSKLQSAPTLSGNYSELSQPDYAITIYRFYQLPVGGAESPGGTQQGGSSSDNTSQQ